MSLLPCPTCPWRVDQTADAIPHYNHGKACGLLDTVGKSDGIRKIMACHGSPEDTPFVCKGYLAREGLNNINVRILLVRGQLDNPADVLDACEAAGIELHSDYPAVLAKLERCL